MVFVVIGSAGVPKVIVDGSIRRLLAFPVLISKACESMVPMKFVAGLVPALPVSDHALATGAGPQPTVPSALTCCT
jgi:hypothetical protein